MIISSWLGLHFHCLRAQVLLDRGERSNSHGPAVQSLLSVPSAQVPAVIVEDIEEGAAKVPRSQPGVNVSQAFQLYMVQLGLWDFARHSRISN